MPPWEKYGQATPAAQAPAAPSPPPFIQGTISPAKQAAEARAAAGENRAAQDQAIQMERLRMSQEDQARQVTKDAEGTADERTAGFLSGRIVDGIGRMSTSVQADSSAASPTMGVEAVRGVFGDTAANYMSDPERQQVRAAQMDVLDAALTLGTGAAYTKEQLEGYRTSYFPQLGDDPSTVTSKQQALRSLIVNAQTKAGRAAPDIEKALAALDAMAVPGNGVPAAKKEGETVEYSQDLGGGLTGEVSDDSPTQPDPELEKLLKLEGDPTGISGIGALAKQGVSLGLSDEAAGIGGAISAFLTGQDPNAAYDLNNRAADVYLDRAREANPWVGGAAELLGGGGAARVASMAPTIGNAMRTGAALGGTGGFGYGEGAGGSTVNALLGAAGGAAIGGGAQLGLNALASRAARVPAGAQPDMDVIAAGQRQNIPIRQPDARPELRGQFGAAEATERGGPVIRQAIADDAAAIEARVGEVGGAGNPSDPYALGSRVQEAGTRYIARTRQQASRLYERAQQESGGATVTARNADAALDANIQELRAAGENSNAAAINYLQGLRDDIDRGLTLQSVQNIRSNMRGQIGERGLTGTDTERRVGQVIDAMTRDLTEQLPPAASQALRAADDFYRQRQEFINGTLQQFMGTRGAPLAAETAATRLTSMAQGKGNFERFSNMWRELEPAEQADVSATIAASLGRQANGNFSVATLIKSLDPQKGVNPRTARLIFGEDGAAALNDLRTIATAKTEAGSQRNFSASGKVMQGTAGGLRNLLLGALGFSGGGAAGGVALPVAANVFKGMSEQRAARMLLNPDFTRWLRNAPNTANPQAIDRYFGRLAGMAGIAANDNAAFVSALRKAFTQSPATNLAAEEKDKDVRREPVNR